MPQKTAEQLLELARKAAQKRRVSEPLTRAEAMAAAPWKATYSPGLERAFREAYADQLEAAGAAKPAKRSGPSGASQTDDERASRGLGRLTLRVSQDSIDRLTKKAEALGCSRGALFESLVSAMK